MMTDFPSLTSNTDPLALLKNSQLTQTQQKEKDLGKTATEFEAMLMGLMFQTLRKTVEPSGLLNINQNQSSTYDYLLDQAVIQQATSNGYTWGLAERLEEAWSMSQKQSDLAL